MEPPRHLRRPSNVDGENVRDSTPGPRRVADRRGAVFLVMLSCTLAACGGSVTSPAASAESNAVVQAGPAEDEDAARGPHDGFLVTVRTDRQRYVAGAEVTFTVETCNLGARTTMEEGGPPFAFTIRDADGRIVADHSHSISTLALRRASWGAGECREDTGSWDQHFWNRSEDAPAESPEIWGLPNRGDEVAGGHYRVSSSSRYGSATSETFTLER